MDLIFPIITGLVIGFALVAFVSWSFDGWLDELAMTLRDWIDEFNDGRSVRCGGLNHEP